MNEPYVIPPDEFGDQDEYETVSLKYFADNILTDYFDVPINNPDELIGSDSLAHFGEYEPDCVYVRNNNEKTDYEILLEPGRYSDLIKNRDRTEE